jgi:LuxR family transcriptional regulator, maltose regulon positive regulatory protein
MSVPILATKLYIPPPRPKIVPRPRLIERLNEGLVMGRKLTLISASAGFGKTTLVSEWIAGSGRPVAWLSLEEEDNDPTRFLTYLIAALQTLPLKNGESNIGARALAVLQSSQPPSTESILTTLLNDITTISDSFLLVLDDYHLIDSQPVDAAMSIDGALAFLIEHQPPQIHLVIATREDPHLPLARLRARGQLTELRAADLRFTPAEAADFLNQVMGLNLTPEDIAALEARTEGWIAGLLLAALSMQGREDMASFIQAFTGSHHFVMDYLVEEVLGQQPESVQIFLLRTSILNRMCGPLCDAVLLDSPTSGQETAGQETLEHLEHTNLFIVPLDNERYWYRYHHLFADLLRQRLGSSQELPKYHLRASEWYEANNDLAEAFNHALAAGGFERAARLAEVAWQGMERSFQSAAWLGWVKKIPNAVICSRPQLCVQLGSAFSDAGELVSSETHLQYAERALVGAMDREEFKSLPGAIALIRADNAQIQGDLAETVKYAELSIRLIPKDDIYLRAQAAITLEFTHWATGDLEASLRAMYAWVEDMQRLGNQVFAIASAFAVADMQVILGRLGEAEKALRKAIQLAAAHGREAETITAHHHLGLALLARERGDDATTAQHLQTAADLGKRTTLVDWPYRWNLAQAWLKESDGEWDTALDLLDEAGRVYVKNPIPILRPVEAHKSRVYLKQGRLDKAASWARERGLSVTDEVNYLGEYEYLTLARVRLGEGVFSGVNELLERLLVLAETQKRTGSVIEILLTQALLHQAQGNHPQALSTLERALALAEPEGYVRIFVDEGKAMRSLIEKQSRNREHPLSSYADKLLAAFAQPVAPPKLTTPKSAIIPPKSGMIEPEVRPVKNMLVEPLSERELEVLRLLRSELSGPEIAGQLIVSLNTLRTHTKNIFNKLGVNNRRAAIRRAEELDLF